MHFVSSSIYQKAIRLAVQEGMSTQYFDKHSDSMELNKGAKYIPIDLLFDIYELAYKHLEPGFGIRQGKQLNADDYGTLGLSWKTCWTAREMFYRVERFMVLVTDHGSLRIIEHKGETSIQLFRDAHRKGVEIANEATFVMIIGVLKEITGKTIHPTLVEFKHQSNAQNKFNEYFHCPIKFEHNVNALHFKSKELEIPTLKADRSIHQFLIERMNEEKKGIHANADNLLKEIHLLIIDALPSGIPSIVQVAEHLGMSARTLTRRLSEKGLGFRQLVQNIQQETSIKLLTYSDQSIAEIAFQTGFSEQSAFNRAFKRWTDNSPADYRKNL